MYSSTSQASAVQHSRQRRVVQAPVLRVDDLLLAVRREPVRDVSQAAQPRRAATRRRCTATTKQNDTAYRSVRDYGGAAPQSPLHWFAVMLGYARDGCAVDAFGATEFSARGWFGRDDLAVVYLPTQAVAGLPDARILPESRLHAVAALAPTVPGCCMSRPRLNQPRRHQPAPSAGGAYDKVR